tara:strand:+ start:1118 stop:1438 length:321 start_codon:yes stop_codon:yes gene_type:complete
MDNIIIKGAIFQCNVGITEQEQQTKQEIIVDVTIQKDLNELNDNINNTLDYNQIHKEIKEKIENKTYQLIETIAEDIAQITKPATITVKKPGALQNTEYAAVTIIR